MWNYISFVSFLVQYLKESYSNMRHILFFLKLYLVAKRVAITILHFCNCNFNLHVDWLLYIVFYAESAIFRLYNGGDYHLWNFEVSLATLRSLLIEIQWNGLLRAKEGCYRGLHVYEDSMIWSEEWLYMLLRNQFCSKRTIL